MGLALPESLDFYIALLRTIFTRVMNLQLTYFFLKHLIRAKTRHGVHSPFVYRLVDEVIYDFKPKTVYRDIEQLRNKLLHDKGNIKTIRPRAKSNLDNESAAFLAKNTLSPARLAQLIYRLAFDFKPKTVIEFGTSFGINTAYLAKAVPEARIISLESQSEIADIVAENLKELSIYNVQLRTGSFDQLLPAQLEEIEQLDFVLIEGNRTKEDVLNYFTLCLPKLSENSLMIFKDIYKDREMREAWEKIKLNSKISVSIDLFDMGLVFVRRGQRKEDFKIRF